MHKNKNITNMKPMITIDSVYKKFNLLIKANCSDYASIAELSKELKVLKTELMEFIENNEKLFNTIQNKKLGLCVKNVYLTPADNPKTEEWLDKMKHKYEKHIIVTDIDNYGSHAGYAIIEDKENTCRNKEYLWRNTKSKIEYLKSQQIIKDSIIIMGSGYSGYAMNMDNVIICGDWQKKLTDLGWTFEIK